MDNGLSRYPTDRHVDGIMGETLKKSKKYNSDLSGRFNVVECLG
jgi:hypothetical protein